MEKDTTRSLSKKLQNIKDDKEAEQFISEHSDASSLHGFLNGLMAEKDITIPAA